MIKNLYESRGYVPSKKTVKKAKESSRRKT